MASWWSIEVFHGTLSAARWREAHEASLVESAITNGAAYWEWHEHRWGVVFEVVFEDDDPGRRSAPCRASGPPSTRCPTR